jgi:hypothetical protein
LRNFDGKPEKVRRVIKRLRKMCEKERSRTLAVKRGFDPVMELLDSLEERANEYG